MLEDDPFGKKTVRDKSHLPFHMRLEPVRLCVVFDQKVHGCLAEVVMQRHRCITSDFYLKVDARKLFISSQDFLSASGL